MLLELKLKGGEKWGTFQKSTLCFFGSVLSNDVKSLISNLQDDLRRFMDSMSLIIMLTKDKGDQSVVVWHTWPLLYQKLGGGKEGSTTEDLATYLQKRKKLFPFIFQVLHMRMDMRSGSKVQRFM